MSAAVATSAVLPDPAAPTRVTIPPKPSAALCKSMSNSPSSADRPARPMSGSVRRGARGLQFQVGEFGLPQPGSLRGQQWYGRDLLPYKDTGGLYKGRLEVDYRIVRERTVLSPRPHSRRLFRSWSGDPTPAPLTGFPAGDGGVLADYLDLPQMQAAVLHCLLSLDHPVDEGGLRDLMLGTGLLDEYEIGQASIPHRIAMLAHNL